MKQLDKYLSYKKINALRLKDQSREEAACLLFKHFISKDVEINERVFSEDLTFSSTCDLIYSKIDNPNKKPIIIYLHGGGWVCGTKEFRHGLLSSFALDGFFVVNLAYTLSPEATHPLQIQEIFRAVEFAISLKDEFNLDTSNIFFMGDSAGAHLVSLAAVTLNNPSLREKLNFPFKEKFEVRGLGLHCGLYNFKTLLKCKFPQMKKYVTAYTHEKPKKFVESERANLLSPLCFAKDFPPSFIVYGEKDKLKSQSLELIEKLREENIVHDSFHAKGLNSFHVFTIVFNTPNSKKCLASMSAFFKKVLKV